MKNENGLDCILIIENTIIKRHILNTLVVSECEEEVEQYTFHVVEDIESKAE